MEQDFHEQLRHLRESLKRIKALLAWERLKCCEAGSYRTSMFQMHDPTREDLKNEYALLMSALLNINSIINDHSAAISQTVHNDIQRQLAEIEGQISELGLQRRFAAPGL
jgi:DNA-binding transcriptional MerR regulator